MKEKKYPINYDFGKNWTSKIVPFLKHEKILKAIKEGVNDYLSMFPACEEKYKKNTAPACYSSMDWYDCILMDRKREIKFKQLSKLNVLPKKYLLLEEKAKKIDTDTSEGENLWIKLMEMKDEILEPYFSWENIWRNPESYILAGSCHYYAPTFELTLAQLVEPEEEWLVRSDEKHTTVINKSHTKTFDLLYWAYNGRLEHYMFGDKLTEKAKNDKTLGGKEAYLDSGNIQQLNNTFLIRNNKIN